MLVFLQKIMRTWNSVLQSRQIARGCVFTDCQSKNKWGKYWRLLTEGLLLTGGLSKEKVRYLKSHAVICRTSRSIHIFISIVGVIKIILICHCLNLNKIFIVYWNSSCHYRPLNCIYYFLGKNTLNIPLNSFDDFFILTKNVFHSDIIQAQKSLNFVKVFEQ